MASVACNWNEWFEAALINRLCRVLTSLLAKFFWKYMTQLEWREEDFITDVGEPTLR